jgi:nucleoside-diphosphate-sugar epimerase
VTGKVLVAGASGLVGSAAVQRFLAEGWEVLAVSRRPPDVEAEGEALRHVPIDLRDRAATREALSDAGEVTHVLYTALYEKPGLVPGWVERDQMETNDAMLRNLLDALLETSTVRHVSLLQGTKAYGVHVHPIPLPARESLPRDEHENFYWLQEDYVRGLASSGPLTFTVFRPQVIFGGSYGVAMNVLPVLGAFAALCDLEDVPFAYPGGPVYPQEGVDSRLLASAMLWAATEPVAANETFNITNGDVFHWRGLWPAIADTVGIETAPDSRRSVVEFLSTREDQWAQIVRDRHLRPTTLTELCGESHHYVDFQFGYELEAGPPYGILSTIKLRQAGFVEFYDTEDTVRFWLEDLIDRGVIPSLR